MQTTKYVNIVIKHFQKNQTETEMLNNFMKTVIILHVKTLLT